MDLLICTASFAVPGPPIVWPKGRIVEASHPMAKKYPQHHAPVESVVYEPSPKPAKVSRVAKKAADQAPADPEIAAEG